MKGLRIGIALVALVAGVVSARAQVFLGGDIGFIFTDHGSRVRLYVEHINNVGDTTTDRLRIRLWGTQDHDDAYFEGRVLSNALVPRVYPHQTFDDLRRTFRLFDPPSGWYYVAVTLEERTFDELGKVHWVVRDAAYLDGQYYFNLHDHWHPFPF
jgi:hypothetical protein